MPIVNTLISDHIIYRKKGNNNRNCKNGYAQKSEGCYVYLPANNN
jgi:hypothetical protein